MSRPLARNKLRCDRATVPSAILTLLVLALGFLPATQALARKGEPPPSFRLPLSPLQSVDREVLPPVDEARYLREDEEAAAAGADVPYRFAARIAISIDPRGSGTWEGLPGGGRVWRLQVVSVGARSLNFGFTRFHLPDGAQIYFYPVLQPADRSVYDGPYTLGDATDGQFWTAVIPGDAAVIELLVPAGASFQPELVLGQVGHDYRGFGSALRQGAGLRQGARQDTCNNDVVCPRGDPWRAEIRSVGVWTSEGYLICSGQMLNSHRDPPPPYFLTAAHCGVTQESAATIVVYWNYESPNCGDLCCGSREDHQSGAILRAKDDATDFCLIEFTGDPDPAFNVFYSGWDARPSINPTESTGIHHPRGQEKAISFNYDPLTVTSHTGYEVPGDGSHWRVDEWEDGRTEPGSSGSGLWDERHHLVGQLQGGGSDCALVGSDWYGRLARSWTGGGSPSSRLMDWLDPESTGVLVLDGFDPRSRLDPAAPPAKNAEQPR